MNLQTVVDTLKEVRALGGPDQRGGSREDHVARGHGSQHSPYSVLPPAASVSLTDPRGLFGTPCFGARKQPAQCCRKAQAQELGSLSPSSGAAPA